MFQSYLRWIWYWKYRLGELYAEVSGFQSYLRWIWYWKNQAPKVYLLINVVSILFEVDLVLEDCLACEKVRRKAVSILFEVDLVLEVIFWSSLRFGLSSFNPI